MAAEYSYPLVQTVAEDENIVFLDGDRACRKGYITHRSGSGSALKEQETLVRPCTELLLTRI